ncbi:MAG: hypothetical protein EPO13_03210 [Actinomycetota bacterium]|nr:MAG: hypothetical protein EPO13_03210 [Actinomycetota bacterium]
MTAPTTPPTSAAGLQGRPLELMRQQRIGLKQGMSGLESALAQPAPGRLSAWADGARTASATLRTAFEVHVEVNEAPDSFQHSVVVHAPHLLGKLQRLEREHVRLRRDLDELDRVLQQVEDDDQLAEARERGNQLLLALVHHRQRGADLVWEAFAVDVGGED